MNGILRPRGDPCRLSSRRSFCVIDGPRLPLETIDIARRAGYPRNADQGLQPQESLQHDIRCDGVILENQSGFYRSREGLSRQAPPAATQAHRAAVYCAHRHERQPLPWRLQRMMTPAMERPSLARPSSTPMGETLNRPVPIPAPKTASLLRLLLQSPSESAVYLSSAQDLLLSGKVEEAIWFLGRSLRIGIQDPGIHAAVGNLVQSSGDVTAAAACYRRGLVLEPRSPVFYLNLTLTLASESDARSDGRIRLLQRALLLAPDLHQAHYLLAQGLLRTGEEGEAERCYRQCLHFAPAHVGARLELGNLFRGLSRMAEAEDLYRQVIILSPSDSKGYGNLGNLCREGYRFLEASGLHQRSTILNPNDPRSWINRGNALKAGGLIQEAVRCYRIAIQRLENCPEAYMNLGTGLYELGNPSEAERAFEHALTIKPDFAEAHWNRSLAHLLRGRFKTGWAFYEWRFLHPPLNIKKRAGEFQEWDGKVSLQGQSILLYAEQGFGDTIQFVRFAEVLTQMGARVTLEVPSALKALFSDLKVQGVIAAGDPAPAQDFQCPLMSLPFALGIDEQRLPMVSGYIVPLPSRVEHWRAYLRTGDRKKVGVIVSGNPRHAGDHARSIPLSAFDPILQQDVDFYLLQKEVREADLAFARGIPNLSLMHDLIMDFADTAALIAHLDLVISVDTSVAHLAAAMGSPTWVLLPFVPDWRWLLDRRDSPWYPSVRLYRQDASRVWKGALEKIAADLRIAFSGPERIS